MSLAQVVGALVSFADGYGLSASFVVPFAAYAFIALFAVVARDTRAETDVAAEPASASPIP